MSNKLSIVSASEVSKLALSKYRSDKKRLLEQAKEFHEFFIGIHDVKNISLHEFKAKLNIYITMSKINFISDNSDFKFNVSYATQKMIRHSEKTVEQDISQFIETANNPEVSLGVKYHLIESIRRNIENFNVSLHTLNVPLQLYKDTKEKVLHLYIKQLITNGESGSQSFAMSMSTAINICSNHNILDSLDAPIRQMLIDNTPNKKRGILSQIK